MSEQHDAQNALALMVVKEWQDIIAALAVDSDIAMALPLLTPFYEAGCAAWIEMDGHTGVRVGCTSGTDRFEVEAADCTNEAIARAICMLVLKVRGVEA